MRCDVASHNSIQRTLRFNGEQFLCLKYFLAKVHTKQNNLLNRKLFLEISLVHFVDYLRQCASLRILEGDDIYNDEEEEVCVDRKSGNVSCSSLLPITHVCHGGIRLSPQLLMCE